ncbi:hypothetical protein ACGFW5_26635 [Streptomyces sp. NPDC048416]|uniref:hypothetical protein n=1 Tax=Streptomyces sp. NPDC048416 TaxID=3365546 RepID=UPI00371DE9CD
MNDELTLLAEAGAAAVVTAMATDAWQETRNAVVALFHPSDRRRRAALEGRLDGNAALIRSATDPDDVRRTLCAYWNLELAALLRSDPSGRAALARLAATVDGGRGRGPGDRVLEQTNTARESGTVIALQYGTQHAYGNQHAYGAGYRTDDSSGTTPDD